jgi:hypothetical protein
VEAVVVVRLGTAVDAHPQRDEIIHDLMVEQLSIRKTAEKYGLSKGQVEAFRGSLGTRAVRTMKADELVKQSDTWLHKLGKVIDVAEKMVDACDRYLADPDDSGRYELGPRADEIDVVYERKLKIGGNKTYKKVRTKHSLQELLRRVESETGGEDAVVAIRYKHADPRELVLKSAEEFRKQMEFIAKVAKDLREAQERAVRDADYFQIGRAIVEATEGYPEVREKIMAALEDVRRAAG